MGWNEGNGFGSPGRGDETRAKGSLKESTLADQRALPPRVSERLLRDVSPRIGSVVRRSQSMDPHAMWIQVSPPVARTRLVLCLKAMMPD